MRVVVVDEYGFDAALFGLGLSHGVTSGKSVIHFENNILSSEYKKMEEVAIKLANKDGGHNKFLRQISVWLDITAPMYWWKEFDTYKVATTAQSESTMHTLLKNPITQECFEHPITEATIGRLEGLRLAKDFYKLVNELPQGWLQRRIVSCNYAVLRNIIEQRRGHKLPEWRVFIDSVIDGVDSPVFLQSKEG